MTDTEGHLWLDTTSHGFIRGDQILGVYIEPTQNGTRQSVRARVKPEMGMVVSDPELDTCDTHRDAVAMCHTIIEMLHGRFE